VAWIIRLGTMGCSCSSNVFSGRQMLRGGHSIDDDLRDNLNLREYVVDGVALDRQQVNC